MAAESVQGVGELVRKLNSLPDAMKRRVLRNALAAGARTVRDEAKRLAPVLSAENARSAPFRKPGTVKDAITVRTSKVARREGNVGVFVNVRPARGAQYRAETLRSRILGVKVKRRTLKAEGQRGAKSRNDPFYWRFLEFGTKRMGARPFLQPAAEKLPDALRRISNEVTRWVNKINQRGDLSA
jgi:HK97 gp10 family phage protein